MKSNKIKKGIVMLSVAVLCTGASLSNSISVEAKSNSAITGVSASKKGKKITVKFKKKSGVKRYKFRYYTISKNGTKSKKSKTKIVNVSKCKKINDGKLSYSFNVGITQNVVVDVTYSKKSSGNNFVKTYSADTCSKHKYVTKTNSTSKEVEDTSVILGYEQKVKSQEDEWKCSGCGKLGTALEIGQHMIDFNNKFSECQEKMLNYTAEKYNVSTDEVYNTICTVTGLGQNETADKYMKSFLEWMNKNTEFKCYYDNRAFVFGCGEDTTTGNTITVYEDDLTKPIYGTKTVYTTETYKQCNYCKGIKNRKTVTN